MQILKSKVKNDKIHKSDALLIYDLILSLYHTI